MSTVNSTLAKKAKPHTIYRLADGTRVPGVTTVLSVLAKPALIGWANRMGLQGIDTTKYVDAAAEAGKAAHAMIECHLKGETFDRTEYAEEILVLADNGFAKYLDWESRQNISNVESELQLVSESLKYGGTVDMYCLLNGDWTLVDFKTNSSGVYDEMRHQVVAYSKLLIGAGRPVDRIIILRLGKSEAMDLEQVEVDRWDLHDKIFRACLELHGLQKLLKS